MNIALPEFDGRIIGVPISFKESASRGAGAEVAYVPVPDRVERVAGLALRLAELRRKPNAEKRVAFVLTNSPGKAARIGNAVGLDAPASLIRIFDAMREAGYCIGELPSPPAPLPQGERGELATAPLPQGRGGSFRFRPRPPKERWEIRPPSPVGGEGSGVRVKGDASHPRPHRPLLLRRDDPDDGAARPGGRACAERAVREVVCGAARHAASNTLCLRESNQSVFASRRSTTYDRADPKTGSLKK